MNRILTIVFTTLIAFPSNAQFFNRTSNIKIESGASLIIEGDVHNFNSGSIDLQGNSQIQVDGDMINSSTINMTPSAKIILGGSESSQFKSNGIEFTNIEIAKEEGNIILQDDLKISNSFTFSKSNNKVRLDGYRVVFGLYASSAIVGNTVGSHFIADANTSGSSIVKKVNSTASNFVFHVGDEINSSFLNSVIYGDAFTSGEISISVANSCQPNMPSEATDYISRFWKVEHSGISNFSAELTGHHVSTDIIGNSNNIKGACHTTEWAYMANANEENTLIGTINESGDFTGMNSFGTASIKAYLDGPFNGSSMRKDLNTLGLLPTTSPYGGGESVDSDFFENNSDIVDWIALETRNSSTPSEVEGVGVGFIKTDGSIVGLDGFSDPIIKNAGTTGYLVLKHRNHLSICTGTSINLDGSANLQDFSDPLYTSFGNNGLRNNGGVMTMWTGDVNGDNSIFANATPSDATAVSNAVLTHPDNIGFAGSGPVTSYNGFINTYSIFDVNLDGKVLGNATPSDALAVSNAVLNHPNNSGFTGSGPMTSYNGVCAQIPQ